MKKTWVGPLAPWYPVEDFKTHPKSSIQPPYKPPAFSTQYTPRTQAPGRRLFSPVPKVENEATLQHCNSQQRRRLCRQYLEPVVPTCSTRFQTEIACTISSGTISSGGWAHQPSKRDRPTTGEKGKNFISRRKLHFRHLA